MDKKYLTSVQLLELLDEFIAKNPELKNIPLLLSEQRYNKGIQQTIIRQLEETDISPVKKLSDIDAIVRSNFDNGIVIGFIPTV